jgi:hypothetical protein
MLYPSTRLQDASVLFMQKMLESMNSFFASFFVLQLLMFISALYIRHHVACEYALVLCMDSDPSSVGLQRRLR